MTCDTLLYYKVSQGEDVSRFSAKNESNHFANYDLFLTTSSPVQPSLDGLVFPPICVQRAPESEIEALA